MAQIQLDPDYSPIRLAVKNNYVYLRVTGGWDLTGLKDKNKDVDYDEIKQTYTFNFYTNSQKTTKKIEKTGASNNNGKIDATLYGLTIGAKNQVTVSISYSYKVRYWKTSSDPLTGADTSDWGSWETKTNSTSNTGALYVYTKNDKVSTNFWGNPSSGDYIDQHITKTNVNAWIDQLGIWKSWKQQDNYYNTYNSQKNPSGDITASWYNTLSGYCNGAYTVSKYNQYISAEHFQDLARKVTTWS